MNLFLVENDKILLVDYDKFSLNQIQFEVNMKYRINYEWIWLINYRKKKNFFYLSLFNFYIFNIPYEII